MKLHFTLFVALLSAVSCTSEAIDGTIVTPHMEQETAPGKSLLYCSTFQIAWNELKGRALRKEGGSAGEPLIVRCLDKGLSTRDDISEDCYVAMAGKGKDGIVKQINKALAEKFGDAAPIINDAVLPENTLVWAYLYKNLEFEKEFEGLNAPISFHSPDRVTKIKAFGIEKYSSGKHRELGRQVEVLEYKDDSEFVIRLKSIRPNDEIVLAKVKPGDTLLETIKNVQKRAGERRAWQLSKGDTLQIPKFDFDITHSYDELLEIYCLWQVARQQIRFRLDEKGAVLKSEARIQVQPEEIGRPRHFVFDKPFLIYLKEKNAKYPYFAVWIENAGLLVKE